MDSDIAPGASAGSAGVSRLEVVDISKTFGRSCVLHGVSLDVRRGEIHGLIGQNGSGKSTLAKVLTGYHSPDPGGRVVVDGRELRLPVRPGEARARGVAVVHQSLGLVNDETVLENLRLGRLRAGRFTRRIRWSDERADAGAVLERLGRQLPLDAKVGSLAEQDRATVAIARALQDAHSGEGVIIFDESTRSLARRTLEHFYEILDSVVKTGTSVLLITHRLEEVIEAADRVTVLRDGLAVESGLETAGLSESDLVHLVLGRKLESLEHGTTGPPSPDATKKPVTLTGADQAGAALAPGVVLTGVSGDIARNVSFDIAPGEIVGVTGLASSGYEELPYLLAGATKAQAGSLSVGGTRLELSELTPQAAIAADIILVPEGRESAGLAMELSVAENAALPLTCSRKRQLMPVSPAAERRLVIEWTRRLDVRPDNPQLPVGKLSGGNQQKVVLAKWLATGPRLMLLHEPTQAVDVGARHMIIRAIKTAAMEGCAVLVAGGDENELALLCDRVVVFRDGVAAQELRGELSADAIVAATFASTGKGRLRSSTLAASWNSSATFGTMRGAPR